LEEKRRQQQQPQRQRDGIIEKKKEKKEKKEKKNCFYSESQKSLIGGQPSCNFPESRWKTASWLAFG